LAVDIVFRLLKLNTVFLQVFALMKLECLVFMGNELAKNCEHSIMKTVFWELFAQTVWRWEAE